MSADRAAVREGACIGGATMLQSWTLRLSRNPAALAASDGCVEDTKLRTSKQPSLFLTFVTLRLVSAEACVD